MLRSAVFLHRGALRAPDSDAKTHSAQHTPTRLARRPLAYLKMAHTQSIRPTRLVHHKQPKAGCPRPLEAGEGQGEGRGGSWSQAMFHNFKPHTIYTDTRFEIVKMRDGSCFPALNRSGRSIRPTAGMTYGGAFALYRKNLTPPSSRRGSLCCAPNDLKPGPSCEACAVP